MKSGNSPCDPMLAMLWARRRHVHGLARRRCYRVGKYTNIGCARKQRETLLELKGPGVIKRLWGAHALKEMDDVGMAKMGTMKLFFYVDGNSHPVLQGPVREIAEAAERLSCPAIPLGGFNDGIGSNLYLPIAFEHSIRIEAELDLVPDFGPYWQIDYLFGTTEGWPPIQQTTGSRGMLLRYDLPPDSVSRSDLSMDVVHEEFTLTRCNPHNIRLNGPAIIRRIEIDSEALDKLLFRVVFDPNLPGPDDGRIDGPFQVDAPLRYLVGPFANACVERIGNKAVIHFPMPFRRFAGIQVVAGMDFGAFDEKYMVQMRIEYEKNHPDAEDLLYFHARFRASDLPNARDGFECCNARGNGHFVGVNLFDTGHDHGGGDTLLLDSALETASVLHGICGEDYFHMASFRVWKIGPYAGSPTHEKRYRHHLEMPVPFRQSCVFNWGTFAGQPSKCVAFWYQDQPSTGEPGRELAWRISGPFPIAMLDKLGTSVPLPETISMNKLSGMPPSFPTQVWPKRAQHGFIDLTHIHRRYYLRVPHTTAHILADVCACCESRVWAARDCSVRLVLGCDDPIRVFLNTKLIFTDAGRQTPDPFKAFVVETVLSAGVNRIFVVVGNTENMNWRWNGFSLVMRPNLAEDEFYRLE